MGKIKKFILECIEDGARGWDAAARGTLCGIAPVLAGMAIAKGAQLFKGILGNRGKIKAEKEKTRKMELEAEGQYASDKAKFANQEGSRQARANFIGSQLKGNRALSPEVLAMITAAKQDPSFKHQVVDTSKGLGWGMAGDIAGQVGDAASAYVKGLGMTPQAPMSPGQPIQNAAQPTTLRRNLEEE